MATMNFVKLTSFILVVVLKTTSCSLVIDSISQKGVYVTDYCPTMKYCVEASHVMCMYYDPHSVMGPRCSNPQNVSITAELANQLLDVTNAIRSKIATGKETGKDGSLLPRGYGIFRLRWDNELATFAQVLANQCVLRHDLCRATKRFPDPGQTAGLVRFTFPDWYPMSRTPATSSPGLNDMKLSYAVTQTLKSWYAQKAAVTEQMLKNYPDWTLTPTNQGGRLYLEMIFGATTHMGCGISAYTEYSYYDNNRQMNYNSIQVICNYSSRPRKGGASYSTDAPSPGHGYTSLCGCPEGSREDADCLCNEYRPTPLKPKQRTETCTSPEGNCEPTLVLLPIFTVEDAPPDKLYDRARQIEEPLANFVMNRLDNMTSIARTAPRSGEAYDFFEEAEKEHNHHQPPSMPHPLKTVLMPALPADDLAPLPPPILPTLAPQLPLLPTARAPYPILPTPRVPHALRHQPQPIAISLPIAQPLPQAVQPVPQKEHAAFHESLRNQYYEKSLYEDDSRRLPQVQRTLPKHSPTIKKSSIFTRVAQFKLPGRKSMSSPFETIKKDVVPRKDFSNINKVVNDYLNRRPAFRRNTLAKQNQNEIQHQEHVQEQQHNEPSPPPNPQPQKEEQTQHQQNQQNQQNQQQQQQSQQYQQQQQPQEQQQQHPQHPTTEEIGTKEEKPHKHEEVTETVLNNVEEKVMNYNRYLKQKSNNTNDIKVIDAKDDNDNKLMSLLDTLEKEVKHIELDGNEKELFDAKIRKIYGSVVGKPPELLSTKFKVNELEIPDSDFGESKTYVKHDSNHLTEDERNIDDERKFNKHSDKPNRIKNYDFLERKKDKHPDILEHTKFSDIIDHKLFNEIDRKYNENIDHKYNENTSDHKYTDLENKYMDDLDRRFNEDRKYGDVKHKYIDKYVDNLEDDRKYNALPAARNQVKYENKEFTRNYKHNSLSSLEDVKYRNFDKYPEREVKINRGDRSGFRIKDERKHRKGTEAKRTKSKAYYNHADDPLSTERRKYYQDKLENLERRLHNSRSLRRKMEHGNERTMRRMRPNRDDTRRLKTQADNFYMPDRARFLHGF